MGHVVVTFDLGETLEQEALTFGAKTTTHVNGLCVVALLATPFLEIETPSPTLKHGLAAHHLGGDFPGPEVSIRLVGAALGQDLINAFSHEPLEHRPRALGRRRR